MSTTETVTEVQPPRPVHSTPSLKSFTIPNLSLSRIPSSPRTSPPISRSNTLDIIDGPFASNAPIRRKAEKYKYRLASAFTSFFVCGWADGTPGTIIPYLEKAYHISHFRVSLIFIAGTIGFAIGTIIVEPLMIHLGRFSVNATQPSRLPHLALKNSSPTGHSISQGRFLTMLFGCLCQILYYTIAVSNPPFWALCVAFSLGGIAISIFSGQMNAYVAGASVRTQGRALGNLHGSYGVGAFASPLVCQSLLALGWSWHKFYLISLVLAIVNVTVVLLAFPTTRKEFEYEKEEALNAGGALAERSDSPQAQSGTMPKSTMKTALKMPYVWLFMAFLMFYTGSETTTGGWIVTYLLRQRAANPSTVGYVASGFWGGLAVGRVVLGHASPYIGIRKEKHLVHLYIALSVVMTMIIWFVPSFVGDAVSASLIGLFLGPIFPTSLSLATKILPKEVHLTALAAMSSVASIGSALFPFAAGILASTKGVVSLQPFMCGILGVMGALWCFFPSRVGMTV